MDAAQTDGRKRAGDAHGSPTSKHPTSKQAGKPKKCKKKKKPNESKEKEKWKSGGNKVVESKKSAAGNRRKHMEDRA